MLDSSKSGSPYKHFIEPTIFCFDDFRQQTGWKSEIDVFPLVELCDALARQFASIRRLFAYRAMLFPCRNAGVRRWWLMPKVAGTALISAPEASTTPPTFYVCHTRECPEKGLPQPTLATLFEVVIDGNVYRVEGKALQRWIVRQRQSLNGPKAYLFSQRPMLEEI